MPRSAERAAPVHPGRRSQVEAHRRSGVANLVVLGRGRVVLGVVQVEPRAVGVLVPGEPVDTGLRRLTELGRGDRRAVLRRCRDRERCDQDQRQGQPGPPHPAARSSRAGAADAGEEQGRQGEPGRQRKPAEDHRRWPGPRAASCRPGPRPQARSGVELSRRETGPASRAHGPPRAIAGARRSSDRRGSRDRASTASPRPGAPLCRGARRPAPMPTPRSSRGRRRRPTRPRSGCGAATARPR